MHLMIDIETLGIAPTSVILSIAAVPFTSNGAETDNRFHELINLDSAIRDSRTIDAHTLAWWLKQPNGASDIILRAYDSKLSHFDCLAKLLEYVLLLKPTTIWSRSPCFDITILENAYNAVRVQVPWHYRTLRDVRTVFGMVNFDKERFDANIKHDAELDCVQQIDALLIVYQNLGIELGE